MALLDMSAGSVVAAEPRADVAEWVVLRLNGPRPLVDSGVAGPSRELRDDPLAHAFEWHRLTVVRPVQQPVERSVPAPKIRIWDVLAAWRAAERELGQVADGSPEWPRLHANVVGLRASYHRIVDERSAKPSSSVRPVVLKLQHR